MTDNHEHDPVADALRRSLAVHAADAPRSDLLAERIIATAEPSQQPRRSRSRWRTWSLPLVAAGAVAGVVAAVVGIQNYHPSASAPPAGPHPPSVSQSVASAPSATTDTTTAAAPGPSPSGTSPLHGIKIIDLTFVGDNRGFALASAQCVGGSGRCTALLQTTDGTHWASMPSTPFNVADDTAGCSSRCVQNIRFANPQVGYVYGPDAFLMTTDGGASWQLQSGGAILLESLDSNVIRVTSSGTGCPSWCNVKVETSAIGSTTWTPATVPGSANLGNGVDLVRSTGNDAYLLFTGHVSGGSQSALSNLVRSTDNGRTWIGAGEPCPQQGGEVDSVAIAGGGGQLVSVLCRGRQAPEPAFVATSSDAGANFAAQAGTVPPATADLLTGDPTTVLVTAGNGLSRSTNGGRTWQRVQGVSGRIAFVGFESPQVGRAVSSDGNTIWTTRDGGDNWTATTLG
jgi:photosystem II stability/assembly factor-like uncharacterized protein